MTTPYVTSSAAAVEHLEGPPAGMGERRFEPRHMVAANLWMIDHQGSTVLRCQCVEASDNGMRLRVPLGYGVAEGQRYELRSHLPGTPPSNIFGVVGSRWATVVRTDMHLRGDDDRLDIGVVLDVDEHPLIRI